MLSVLSKRFHLDDMPPMPPGDEPCAMPSTRVATTRSSHPHLDLQADRPTDRRAEHLSAEPTHRPRQVFEELTL
jgi:hypothetical protein